MTTRRVVRLLVTGRVQGVGFRAWIAARAGELGLDGWVRNRRSGDVEAVLAGDAEVVTALIVRCHEGPRTSLVTRVDVQDAAEMPPRGFRVLADD